MENVIAIIKRAAQYLIGFLKFGSGFCLLAMMAITCADVVGRYVFNIPLFGALELTEILLAAVIFFALPLVTLRGEHVTIDVLDAHFSDRSRSIQNTLANIICGVCAALITYRLWDQAHQMLLSGEQTAQLGIKLGWLVVLLVISMFLTCCAFFLIAMKSVEEIDKRDVEAMP